MRRLEDIRAALVLALAVSSTVYAQPATHHAAAMNNAAMARPIPEILDPESISPDDTYITGGIGEEERNWLESQQANYNLHILSTNTEGAYKGDTHIIINDRHGEEIVNALAGPIFYAALPPGTYTVQAFDRGRQQTKRVTLRAGKAIDLRLSW